MYDFIKVAIYDNINYNQLGIINANILVPIGATMVFNDKPYRVVDYIAPEQCMVVYAIVKPINTNNEVDFYTTLKSKGIL